jgi:uncharacterized protein (DUF58 family)
MKWPEFRPRRTLRPTRDGWWCLIAAVGLGIAAVNSRNNLLYLLVSMLLALIVVSGILSEQSIRGLRLVVAPVEDLHAGRSALLHATVVNGKRWLASYSISVEVLSADRSRRSIYVPKVPVGASQLITWEETPSRRGRQRLPGLRITTRFPFGLFWKGGRVAPGVEVVVFPALVPMPPDSRHQGAGEGEEPARRQGQGHDLYNLREYVLGDDPRLIHWRSSAKTASLIVRDLEAPTQLDTRIVLVGTGVRHPEQVERGLSEAAWLTVELIRAGAAVELVGPGLLVPVATGRAQERRILTELALYDPDRAIQAAARCPQSGARLREIRVVLG